MAWKGQVLAQNADVARGTCELTVAFADMASPSTVLATEQFYFPISKLGVDALREVQKRGQELRDSYLEKEAMPNYIGQVINIP